MKKATLLVLAVMGVVVALTSFRHDYNKPAGNQQPYLANHRAMSVRCSTAAGTPYAVRTSCVPNPGTLCGVSQCPAGFFDANRRSLVTSCVDNGQVVAFGNSCMPSPGSICKSNYCPFDRKAGAGL